MEEKKKWIVPRANDERHAERLLAQSSIHKARFNETCVNGSRSRPLLKIRDVFEDTLLQG